MSARRRTTDPSVRLVVLCSERERERWHQAARARGLTLSTAIRIALDQLAESTPAAPPDRQLPLELEVTGRRLVIDDDHVMALPCIKCGHTRCGPECTCTCAGQPAC